MTEKRERDTAGGSRSPFRPPLGPSVGLLVLAVLAVAPQRLEAQLATVAAGQAVLADSAPLKGARILLHRVGRDRQGPVDSTLADARGRFRFRFRPDTSALYLLSVRYGGIEYFSTPVRTNPDRPDSALRLVAYDTSSTAPIAVEARHIVVPRPGESGARAILDLIILRNDGRLARVSPDLAHPAWTVTLPPGTGAMDVGESDLSPDAVVREGDTVKLTAPISPGQKQLSLQYAVLPPGGRLVFAVGSADAPVNVLVEEDGARVSGGTLALADSQVIEGRRFRRWTGRAPAGGTVTVSFAGVAGRPSWRTLVALVFPVAAVLAFAAWRSVRRTGPPAPARSHGELLDAIAALDARYAGREAETEPDEWQRYQAERAALKARLESALAPGGANRYV
jgi:hypothetical protein